MTVASSVEPSNELRNFIASVMPDGDGVVRQSAERFLFGSVWARLEARESRCVVWVASRQVARSQASWAKRNVQRSYSACSVQAKRRSDVVGGRRESEEAQSKVK